MQFKIFFTLFMVLGLLPASKAVSHAQTCSCTFAQTIAPAGSWANDFNCYQYVKAYYYESRYGTWIPPSYNSIASTYSSNSILNDPNFVVVSDPAQANAVYFPCQHAAVILPGGCLVEKVGFGSELRKHGLNNGSCGPPTGATYLKYVNRGPGGLDTSCLPGSGGGGNPPSPCNISGTWTSSGISLNTVNYTANYYNQVSVSCSSATSFTWSIQSGSALYGACSNSNCSTYYFYLNTGQSVTYRVRAMNGTTQVGIKDYTFYRTSGGGYYLAGGGTGTETGNIALPDARALSHAPLTLFPNPAGNELFINFPDMEASRIQITDATGRILNLSIDPIGDGAASVNLAAAPNGIYFIRVLSQEGQLLQTRKFVVSR